MESSCSSLDVTDLSTPKKLTRSESLGRQTGGAAGAQQGEKGRRSKFFKSFTLQRRKGSLQEPPSDDSKKRRPSFKKTSAELVRFLSFKKLRKKSASGGTSPKASVTDEEEFGSCSSLRAADRQRPDGDDDPGALRNASVLLTDDDDDDDNDKTITGSSRFDMDGRRAKKTTGSGLEEASTDSFKSVEASPELRNASGSSETAGQGGSCKEGGLSERSFSVFEDNSFLEEIREGKKKSVFRLLRKKKPGVVVYSKTSSDLVGLASPSTSEEDVSMSSGAIRKEGKPRGRGSAVKTGERKKRDEDEEVLKKSAILGQQLLKEKQEEGDRRVTGDELRKQLTEGLKTNGNGKKDGVKEQILAITKPALEKGEMETQSFIEQEKGEGGEGSGEKEGKKEGEGTQGGEKVEEKEKEKEKKAETSHPEGKREHLYKILVIGELGTGKTSIIKRYVHQFFSQHYRATIGVDFALKVLNWDQNTIIRLQLWDIAGQERFGNMTRVYYKEAVGAFIVFDVTRAATFDAVLKWKLDLDSKVQLADGSPIPCILLANKCDQPKEGLVNNKSKMDEYCSEKGFSSWFETSAKENINIEEAAKSLVNKILQNDKLVSNGDQQKDGEKFGLDRRAETGSSKGCSC